MDEMPQLRHPFVFKLTQVIGSYKVNQDGDPKFDDMSHLAGYIVSKRPICKQKIKKRIQNKYDNQSAYPPIPFTIVQIHG